MTNERIREIARKEYASEDIQIEADAMIATAEDGAFVAAWVWVDFPKCAYCGKPTDNPDLLCDACDAENARHGEPFDHSKAIDGLEQSETDWDDEVPSDHNNMDCDPPGKMCAAVHPDGLTA